MTNNYEEDIQWYNPLVFAGALYLCAFRRWIMPSLADMSEIYASQLGPCWACKPMGCESDDVLEANIAKLKENLWKLQGEPWIPKYKPVKKNRYITKRNISTNSSSICNSLQIPLVCTCGDEYKRKNFASEIRKRAEYCA